MNVINDIHKSGFIFTTSMFFQKLFLFLQALHMQHAIHTIPTIRLSLGYGIYGRQVEDPTQKDIENAAEQAQIDKFIKSQDAGYDLHVGERGLRYTQP